MQYFESLKALKMSKSAKSRRRIRSACIEEIDSIEKGAARQLLYKNPSRQFKTSTKIF